MRTPEEWYVLFLKLPLPISPNDDLDVIEQIQTEAWNEAVDACANDAEDAVLWNGGSPKDTKKSILKLRI